MEVQIFKNPVLGQVKMLQRADGEILFVASDVAKGLGFRDANSMTRSLDLDEKGTQIVCTPGGEQMMVVITESGFYHAAMKSRVEKAKAFRKWVTSEVLPEIRRTGGYIPTRPEDDETTVMARALLIARNKIELQNKQLAEQRPLAELGEAVSGSKDSILIRDLAKLLTQNGVPMGQNRLFAWLRQHGYLFQHETRPIQLWVERGIFDLSVNVIATHHGTQERITTRVTGKGQRYFLERMLREMNGRDEK